MCLQLGYILTHEKNPLNIENHRLPDGEYTAIFSLSSSSSETHCCLREIRWQIRCWSVIVGFHCLCDCRLSVRKRLQKLLTSCSCRNRPSSSVTELDLSASCFCTLIIVTLSLTCDLRHNTRVLLRVHVWHPEMHMCITSILWSNGKLQPTWSILLTQKAADRQNLQSFQVRLLCVWYCTWLCIRAVYWQHSGDTMTWHSTGRCVTILLKQLIIFPHSFSSSAEKGRVRSFLHEWKSF